MERHRQFEYFVADILLKQGYTNTKVTPAKADWGVDLFCEKDGIKYVAQVKMYGECKAKVCRRHMLELYGVMHYFDCQGALLIYNGRITDNARLVADKLKIKLIYIDQHIMDTTLYYKDIDVHEINFDIIWNEIQKLEGHIIQNSRGTSYTIKKVTTGDITYINKNGKKHKETIDIFRRIAARILQYDFVQQCQLRDEYDTKASAFIATVFANIPSCEVTPNPTTIRFKK